ncbi:aldehyde ferredoxin oxidoreductase family protein [Desulfococcaceae bacterium HSG9]|nr:aldehyde ferredoxin oxidoreductase family protein [Desulfococcaceae bacterium HSG9]
MNKGYMGKILMADLGTGLIEDIVIPETVYKNYLAGMGLGAYQLYNQIPAGAAPLGPENILGFVAGLLTGSGSYFSGRWMAVGKSPLTGGWGESNCGGNFAPAIKRCGYDGIFFKGVSETPVYLTIQDGKAKLCDASHVWGRDTVETELLLMKEIGGKKKARVVCIGPAGEKCSLIAGISNDRGRMAARSGLGAVMGAKKLKAVVLSGSEKISVHDKVEIRRLSRKCKKYVKWQPPFVSGPLTAWVGALMRFLPTQLAMDGMLYKIMLKKWGTVSMNQMSVEIGDAPIKNWKGTNRDFGPDKSAAVNPDAIIAHQKRKYHCYSCPLGCGGICTVKGKHPETHKPEYETVLSLGGLCMNADADSIFYLNEMLNRAGMDTISVGGTVAFAMECYEAGLITTADTDGLELTWGNTDAIVALIRKMIKREGIGDLLADGVKRAAEKLGEDAAAFAVHAGGQELPMHDGRNDPGFALHYSVEPAPGRHNTGSQLYYEMYRLWKKNKNLPKPWLLYFKGRKYKTNRKKAVMAVACGQYMNVLNGAGVCMFGAFIGADRIPVSEWLNAATGWDKTLEQYMEIGERIQAVKQLFNCKHGIRPETFMPNQRTSGHPPLTQGANKGRRAILEPVIRDYYELLGWDVHTGKPTSETVRRLNVN